MLRGKNIRYKGGGTSPVTPPPPVGPQYYAANAAAGSGSGLDAANPCLIASAWAIMAADAAAGLGPTLNLANGTYTGANSMIVPTISGTVAAYVTVRATNEGQVLIDGQSARVPVFGNQVDYINLIGINAKRSITDVVNLSGCFGWLVQRVCAWDAIDHNRLVLVSNYGRSNVFEDCAAFGIGRKMALSYQTAGPATFRRCWLRWQQSTVVGPKIAGSLAYDSYFTLFENCITTWDQVNMPDPYTLLNDNGTAQSQAPNAPGTGCKQVALPYGVVQGDNSCLINSQVAEQTFGVISADGVGTATGTLINWNAATTYNAAPRNLAIATDTANGIVYFSLQNNNINHQPSLNVGTWWSPIGPAVVAQATMLGCISYQKTGQSAIQPSRLIFFSNIDGITVNNCAAIFSNDASFGPTTLTGSTRQPFLLGNSAVSHTALIATNNSSFRGQASASSVQSNWSSSNFANTTTPAAYYPVGQSLYSNDGAHGATIRYRYVNGLLTSTALWPWPMNQRIIDATTAAGYAVEDVNATMQGFFGTFI